MHHFVLVHGSCVGGWCWYKLVHLLRSAGHKATVVDLGASGIHPKQCHELSTIADYFEPLMQAMASIPPEEKVVLVGHSMGGVAAAVAMEKFPRKISVAVFLTAYMPGPHLTRDQITQAFNIPPGYGLDTKYTFDQGEDKPPTSFFFGPEYISTRMYGLSPPEDVVLAKLLARPYPNFFDQESEKECEVTEENYGSLPRVYIKVPDDNGLNKDFQQVCIDRNPPNEVREIKGADHMVMSSKPQELLSQLVSIADKYK